MKKYIYPISVIATIVYVIAFFAFSCSLINRSLGLQDDNLGEEAIEFAIGSEDLTAGSPE